ncbi:hypothetical protein BST27_17080 [Mycobacterium intermedium]|uniref:Uncharacterized protein n=1 Tax=Mycobacterium intermedium TaxID=28445 RepID=A0A1E3SDR0_MYCIE|nr:hypothetical protein [Mycobacterium intermedium]MCV6966038.1 hypothetical protein [Mycobacterium intermedium]ODR00294.1 hypothetical protein BHQ20_13095 [Mycobacterium intermedium]OPE45139.1 hypothetical protein BV508_30525 [Mycobacterium intermedium]ORB01897.1 hypothetical protein BST27_17080 [Mycobacterium intermedium]
METQDPQLKYGAGNPNRLARKRYGCDYKELNPDQREQIAADQKTYYENLALSGREARRRYKAIRLREQAEALVIEADAIDAELAAKEAARAIEAGRL